MRGTCMPIAVIWMRNVPVVLVLGWLHSGEIRRCSPAGGQAPLGADRESLQHCSSVSLCSPLQLQLWVFTLPSRQLLLCHHRLLCLWNQKPKWTLFSKLMCPYAYACLYSYVCTDKWFIWRPQAGKERWRLKRLRGMLLPLGRSARAKASDRSSWGSDVLSKGQQ